MDKTFTTDFELYKVFFVTAESKTITDAARMLFLTQPSVTRHIQKLEEHLGCKLFVRSKRGVTLTSDGKQLMRWIGPACRMILAAERGLGSLESGTVSIASTEMGFKVYVLPIMRQFTKKYPKVKICFTSVSNGNTTEIFREGTVDLALLHQPFQLDENMSANVIELMHEYMVCGQRFMELAHKRLQPSELLNYPFVSMPKGSPTMEYLHNYFSQFNLNFDPGIELSSVELMHQAIECGLGIGILPECIAAPAIEKGRLFRIPLETPLPQREVCLVTDRRFPLSAVSEMFVRELIPHQSI